ncbi:MAG: hypothetical protein JWN21_1310 [Sphingomonas bacterium]|uniref:hypothetical protein n=1 Tax=Sphingomonas bacterium TaxID=1895847 RepID=UPI002635C8B5|nr:hypothetical protein [Sphingomonas bacterium]MDB5695767.1 hypothetical protein [Sphingomonas bacterium]
MEEAMVATPGGRVTRALDRAEVIYLRVLRAAILIVATVLLVLAAIGAATALYKIAQSPNSVVEQASTVAADELAGSANSASAVSTTVEVPRNSPAQRRFYDDFAKRYHGLYRAKFERFQRPDDKKPTVGEFDDLTIDTAGRLRAIADGELSFDTDRADLETYLTTLASAADLAETQKTLEAYRRARKARVASRVERVRYESRRGWDSLSTTCPAWYESPIGCAVTRQVPIPYNATVYTMRYPDGVQSPSQVIKAYQDRYFSLLAERRASNAAEADAKRESILIGKAEGRATLLQVGVVLGGFLLLMFFFLLIAIERHQRRLAREPAPSSH